MSSFESQSIDVFYLYRHGHLIACGLSEDALYAVAPSLRHDLEREVVSRAERVGHVHGEVLSWSKRGGHSFNPKLHWSCPNCGQQWWTAFNLQLPNPAFEDSGCSCVSYWLVSWDLDQAERELK